MKFVNRKDVLNGLGLGAFVATGFSLYATFLRLTIGTAPFERAGTGYLDTVLIYYGGFMLGGVLLGALLPLRRWAIGSVVLGFLGVLPVYGAFVLLRPPNGGAPMSWKVAGILVASLVVGGGVGLYAWSNDFRRR